MIGGLATAIGAGAAASFRWFTGDKSPPSGPAAVLLVSGVIFATPACASAQAHAAAAQAEYAHEQARCLDAEPALADREDVPLEVRKAAWGRYDACLEAVRQRWGITETVSKDGGP